MSSKSDHKPMTNIRDDFEKAIVDYWPEVNLNKVSTDLYCSSTTEIAWEMYKTGIRHALTGVE